MVSPSATWTTKQIKVTYRSSSSPYGKEAGSYVARLSGRIRNTLADGTKQVFRARTFASGTLNTTEGVPSLVVDAPIIDDPDNSPQGGEVVLTVTFDSDGSTEVYHLQPLNSWATSTDIADFLTADVLPATYLYRSVPGGVAGLDADGDVINAAGIKVTGSGGGSLTNYSQVQSLTGYPAVIAAGTTQAAARTAIGAGTSNLVVGTTSTDAKAGNWTPTVSDLPASVPIVQGLVSGAIPARPISDVSRTVLWMTPISMGQPPGMLDIDLWLGY